MKHLARTVPRIIKALLTLLMTGGAAAATLPEPPSLPVRNWLLIEASGGRVLSARNATARADAASLSRLMTLYIVLNQIKAGAVRTSDPAVVTAAAALAAGQTGARLYLDPRQPPTLETLLAGLCVIGARDAAVALAQAVSGDEARFAARMNSEAARLGLRDTRFLDPAGRAGVGAYTTAQDALRLASVLISEHPQAMQCFGARSITYRGIEQHNSNRLLWLDAAVDGFAEAERGNAGWSMIATARRGGHRLLAAVGGARSDNEAVRSAHALLNFGFQSFDALRLYDDATVLRRVRVYGGEKNAVNAGFPQGLVVTVPRDRAAGLRLQFQALAPLQAPIERGQRVGTLHLLLDGRPYGEYPVLALERIERGNWLARSWDALRLWLKGKER